MRSGISVIIPTYNRQEFISAAIKSVLEQEYDGQIEVIVSDDGSTDKTVEIAKSFGHKVIVGLKPANWHSRGVAANRNRGLRLASQPLVCFLDSDDFYLPGHLKSISACMEKNPACGFAFCRMLEMKKINGKQLFKPWTHSRIFDRDVRNVAVSRSRIVHTNAFIFRRSVFDTVGYFDEVYTNGEDTDLWMRVSEKYKGCFSDHYGAVYTVEHDMGQLTKNAAEHLKKSYSEIYEKAIKRYHHLQLTDRYRLFKLKHWLVILYYRQQRWQYYGRYLNLILTHPITFISSLPLLMSEYQEKRNRIKWRELNYYQELMNKKPDPVLREEKNRNNDHSKDK